MNVHCSAAEVVHFAILILSPDCSMHLAYWIQVIVPFGLISHCSRAFPLQVAKSRYDPTFDPSVCKQSFFTMKNAPSNARSSGLPDVHGAASAGVPDLVLSDGS